MLLAAQDPLHDSIFFEKEIWLFIFGGLILLYVIAAIYSRIKRPKKEIKTIKVKVLSVSKVMAQTAHQDVGFDRAMSGKAVSASKFEVTFIDENSGETYIFAVSASQGEKLYVGKAGELCYNGDELISFGHEVGQEKAEKIYFLKKRVLPLVICGVIVVGIGVWAVSHFFGSEEEQESIVIEDITNRPLTIYMFSHAFYGDEIINASTYSLGEFRHLQKLWGNTSHIYYDAVESYKKETGKEIQIEFFDIPEEMFEKAYEEWKNGAGPDVIIGDYVNNGCLLYPYISEGMLADMGGYFENDALYSSGEYVEKVLEGGRIGQDQLVFPLTFNMNMLYTSEERMNKHGIWLSEDMLYEEMLTAFQDAWNEVRDEDEYLMLNHEYYRNRYPVLLFQSASGINMIEYETGKIQLSIEDFSDWANLYESYICNEYQMSREELKEFVVQNPDISIPYEDSMLSSIIELCNNVESDESFDIIKENTFSWSNGGTYASNYRSFAAHTNYYESRMKDEDETFVPIAIPSKHNPGEYAAEIASFGVILSNSKKTDEAYEFIKALADYKHFMHLDLSVNRQVLIDTLDELSTTNFSLQLRVGGTPAPEISEEDLMNNDEEVQKILDIYHEESYFMQALSEESKDYLLNMVEHIGIASLPEGQLDGIIIEEIGRYIWEDVDTIENAYHNTIQRFIEMGYQQ